MRERPIHATFKFHKGIVPTFIFAGRPTDENPGSCTTPARHWPLTPFSLAVRSALSFSINAARGRGRQNPEIPRKYRRCRRRSPNPRFPKYPRPPRPMPPKLFTQSGNRHSRSLGSAPSELQIDPFSFDCPPIRLRGGDGDDADQKLTKQRSGHGRASERDDGRSGRGKHPLYCCAGGGGGGGVNGGLNGAVLVGFSPLIPSLTHQRGWSILVRSSALLGLGWSLGDIPDPEQRPKP